MRRGAKVEREVEVTSLVMRADGADAVPPATPTAVKRWASAQSACRLRRRAQPGADTVGATFAGETMKC